MPSDDRTEYRVALVFNGGVSLAVWMSGVVREIDLIRRASCGEELSASSSPSDHAHYATWKRVLDPQIKIVVDIIAGTSAGGLNGALLAMALACGTDLPDLKAMWNEKAAPTSAALLGNTDRSVRGSVLSGRHLQKTLRDMLVGIRDARRTETPHEVTLFVTATALGQSDLRYSDMAGESFLVADHRRLYRFSTTHLPTFDHGTRSFAPNRDNDFTEHVEALATAGRASASYPVAFAPVPETSELRDRRYPADPSDPTAPDTPAPPRYLMDGGILDNAPIEPVIDEIGRRVPDARVERVLAYVVPSNGVVARPPEEEADTAPPKWVKVVGSALDFPRESDFRHDITAVLEALGADRSRGQTSVALLGRAVGSTDVREELAAGAEALLVSYRAGRIEGSLRQVRDRLAARAANGPELKPSQSGSGMAYRAVSAGWVPPPDTGAAAAVSAASWPFGFSGARRTVRLLLKAVRMDMDGGRHDLRPLAEELSGIDAEITALEKVVGQTVEAAAGETDDDPTLIGRIDAAFAEVGAADLLTERMTRAVGRYAEHHVLPADLGVDGLRAVLAEIEIVTGAAAGDTEDQDPPSFVFVRLGPDVESKLYPGEDRGGNKLYGASLGHFGAFGNREWRECDYTWGRLDAAAHVVKLIKAAKLIKMDDATTRQLEQEVVAAEGWASPEAFRQATLGAGQDTLPTLRRLTSTDGGWGVLFGVTRSAVGLLGHQGWSMLRDGVQRLVGSR